MASAATQLRERGPVQNDGAFLKTIYEIVTDETPSAVTLTSDNNGEISDVEIDGGLAWTYVSGTKSQISIAAPTASRTIKARLIHA